jgi:hypothetical protein
MVDKLLDLLPPLDVNDPLSFIAGIVQIFSEYPADVMLAAIDPAHGIPSRADRPTLRLIKTVCEEYYEPIAREEDRARAQQEILSTRALPQAPRAPAEQATIDAKVAAARRELGIPADGVPPRGMQARSPRWDRPISKSVLADLEARRIRNQALEPEGRNQTADSGEPES